MVDLNAHEAGNGGQKPREAYSLPSLLYSEIAGYHPGSRHRLADHGVLGGSRSLIRCRNSSAACSRVRLSGARW